MPIKNGGKTDKFTWTQEINSLMLIIDIPFDTNKKTLKVNIEKKKLSCSINGKMILDGELSNECIIDDSYYQIETDNDKKQLLISLQKTGG